MANKKKTKKPVKKVVKKAVKKAAPKKAAPKKGAPKKVVAKKTLKKVAVKGKAKTPAPKKTVAPKATTIKKENIDYSKAISPLGDRLVVRLELGEKLTAGGLIIPDTVSQVAGFLKAKVLAVGSGSKNKKGNVKPLEVKMGDIIFFSQHAGTKIQFNSEDLQIIKETDVMGVQN